MIWTTGHSATIERSRDGSRRSRCRALLFFLFLCAPVLAYAQSKVQNLIISADQSDRDNDLDVIDLVGNVQIIHKDQHLLAQKARINLRSKTIDAVGQVQITSNQSSIMGERAIFDFESNTGMIFNGVVQSGTAIFEGAEIFKSGDAEYFVSQAKFSTCKNCPETWSFTGERIRAELGGYAFIKNSVMRIGGVPVFWLPYLAVPLRSDRQTGLLPPSIGGSDSGGVEVSESFFWVIDRNQDATITVTNFAKRGLKAFFTYEYRLSPNSGGEFNFSVLRDRVFQHEKRVQDFSDDVFRTSPSNRWFLKYDHVLELPDNYSQHLQINNASDLQYAKDFYPETGNVGDPAMETRLSLTRNRGQHHFSVDSSYYINMLQPDPFARGNDSIHRMPEIRYSRTSEKIGDSNWIYNLNAVLSNFTSSEFGYDDMTRTSEGRFLSAAPRPGAPVGTNCNTPLWYENANCVKNRDGTYDPGLDQIRAGQRLDMQGSLVRPFRVINVIDILPRVTFRQTQYQFNIPRDRDASRSHMRLELSGRSVFSSIYGDLTNYRAPRWKHEIQPEVSFKTIPWAYQSRHDFFGSTQNVPFFSQENISDGDINSPFGLQFDHNDRIFDRRVVTTSLTNRIIAKRWAGNTAQYSQDLSWRLSQSYDFYELETQDGQPLSDLRSEFQLNLTKVSLSQLASFYPYHQATNVNTTIRYNFPSGDFLALRHNHAYTIVPRQPLNRDSLTTDYTISARATYWMFDVLGKVTLNPRPAEGQSAISSYGYGVGINLPGDCWHIYITTFRPPSGDNSYKAFFNFNWDGTKKAQVPEDFLTKF